MPEDLKVSQIGSSPLPPLFRGLHSPGVRKRCQIIFACYFRKSSINNGLYDGHVDKRQLAHKKARPVNTDRVSKMTTERETVVVSTDAGAAGTKRRSVLMARGFTAPHFRLSTTRRNTPFRAPPRLIP